MHYDVRLLAHAVCPRTTDYICKFTAAGQHKEVTIYRLVTRDTYEAKVFEISSRKAGAAGGGSVRGAGRGLLTAPASRVVGKIL